MALGFFRKVGDFFKKAWGGIKKVAKPVIDVGKKVWEVAKPVAAPLIGMIPGVGAAAPMITQGIDTGLNVADKVVNGTVNANDIINGANGFIKFKKV